MFIELVDSLRCLSPHDETWLVAAASRMDGRHLIDGVLGCPVCRREYAIRDGTAWFSTRQPDAADENLTMLAADSDPGQVTRTAALRGVAIDGGGASLALLSSAASSLRSRGRLVAPSDAAVPDGFAVLARDDRVWVAERTVVASPPVALRSVRR